MFENVHASRKALLVLFGCTVCQLCAGLFYATRALAPDVIEDLGWTRTMWSSGMAPMLLVSSMSQPFVGIACIRFGVRAVAAVSLLIIALTFVVLAGMQSLWHFYLAMGLLALGNAGIGDVVISSVVTRWFDRARGLALGLAFTGSNLGAIVSIQLMATLAYDGSWRRAALLVGIGSVIFVLPIAMLTIREPRPGEAADDPIPGTTALERPARVDSVPLASALRRPAFWIFFYTLFCYSLAQMGMYDHLVLYLTDLGYSKMEAAGALEFTVGAGVISKLGAGVVALRLSAKGALVTNTGLLALSFALIPFAENGSVLALFGLTFGVSTAARDVLFPLLLARVFGVRHFAAIYGFLMISYFPGGGLGPIGLARVHDVLGSYQLGFGLCAALIGAAAIGLLSISQPNEDRSV
jgi:predicted MFS family arabinose efflux permease